ncbi:hypothetical protein EDD17DRAFT_1514086 [Pisolithus thermaeus]|nr:hypothetical protein EV401DRAFT_1887499 [Pisolithus croceorrhizus]KAI6148994.1 hypothetical protein EDD17DRAFT_1514086 [Pisolithus thermaeus]
MSQPSSLIPTPPATTVQDCSAVLDSAIQSNSDDDKAVAKAKYDERQHQKKAQKEQKVAEEAAAQERVENEHQEREVAELHRQEEAECQEREENECWEWEVQAWVASQVKGAGSQSHDSVVSLSVPAKSTPAPAEGSQSQGGPPADHMTCARCTWAEVECTYKLAKAISTKKVWKHIVVEESMSLRAGEKKKHARAESLEVEIVESSQSEKGKGVTHDTLITRGLYTIATVIDQHTKEVVQLLQVPLSMYKQGSRAKTKSGQERPEVEAWHSSTSLSCCHHFTNDIAGNPYYRQNQEEHLGCSGAGGILEAREHGVVGVGKGVKNEWEYHVTRKCEGLELSAGEVWLVSMKAGRSDRKNGCSKEQTFEPEVFWCGMRGLGVGIPDKASQKRGLSKPSGKDTEDRVNECRLDFWSKKWGFGAGQSWEAHGLRGLKPRLDRGPLPDQPQLMLCALGQGWVWSDTDYLDSWLRFLVDYLTGAAVQI